MAKFLQTSRAERRLRRKKSSPASRGQLVVGLVMAGLVVLLAAGAPVLALQDPYQTVLADNSLAPFSRGQDGTFYLFGTDDLGRDLFSRFAFGARYPLLVGVLAVLVGGFVGITFGILAGYFQGAVDTVLSRLADIQMSIPGILVAITLLAFFGGGVGMLVAVVAIIGWPTYFRLVRVETMSIRQRAFIEAAVTSSASSIWIILRHVLPNLTGIIAVVATLDLSRAVLMESGMSFLGLGIQPPAADWGVMVAMGQPRLATEWWISTIPGIGIIVLVFGVNLIGDWFADRTSSRRPMVVSA